MKLVLTSWLKHQGQGRQRKYEHLQENESLKSPSKDEAVLDMCLNLEWPTMLVCMPLIRKGGAVNHYPWIDCPGGKATLQKTPGLLSVSLNKVSSPSAGQQGDSRSWE